MEAIVKRRSSPEGEAEIICIEKGSEVRAAVRETRPGLVTRLEFISDLISESF